MTHYQVDNNLNIELKKDQSKRKKKESSNFLLAKYANVGYYVVTPLLVGVFLGLGLDAYFRTKPVFTVTLIILGTVSVFYNLFKLTKDTF